MMSQTKESNKQKGDEGENLAAAYLEKQGYTIVERKWKSGGTEIDLIAIKENVIAFVEVKLRYSDMYGQPWEAVNKAKQKKICACANTYIHKHKVEQEPRFDIISIIKSHKEFRMDHIEQAFRPMA